MFELEDTFGGLPPAIVDHQLLLMGVMGVGTIFYWLVLCYYRGQYRKVWKRHCSTFQIEIVSTQTSPQLIHIPLTGSDVPLFTYIGAWNYFLDPRNVVKAGVKKVSFCATVAPYRC